MLRPPDLTASTIHTLLCDADGTLFASEEAAFDASVEVTNRCLEQLGIDRRFTAIELRLGSSGKNFRATITELAQSYGVAVEDHEFRRALDGWVAEENDAVITHLAEVLAPDLEVSSTLRRLSRRFELAVVSSSAMHRVSVCLERAGISDLFASDRRFSAQDSLPVPTSKPDPAIYQLAGEELSVTSTQAIAIEDAAAGAESAVRAGLTTVGMLCFVPLAERGQRIHDLEDVGVVDTVTSWPALERLLAPARGATEEPDLTPTVKVHP
jgi:beta-phosphoglucomutase-like phosphatase (HAD superfamily)